jgi:hypothetical protein
MKLLIQEIVFEDTKEATKSRKLKKDRQYNGQKKKNKTMINQTVQGKPKIDQNEPH